MSRQSGRDPLFLLKTGFRRVKGTQYYICDATLVGGGRDLVDSDLSPSSSETPSPLDKNDQLVELSKTYILAKKKIFKSDTIYNTTRRESHQCSNKKRNNILHTIAYILSQHWQLATALISRD